NQKAPKAPSPGWPRRWPAPSFPCWYSKFPAYNGRYRDFASPLPASAWESSWAGFQSASPREAQSLSAVTVHGTPPASAGFSAPSARRLFRREPILRKGDALLPLSRKGTLPPVHPPVSDGQIPRFRLPPPCRMSVHHRRGRTPEPGNTHRIQNFYG